MSEERIQVGSSCKKSLHIDGVEHKSSLDYNLTEKDLKKAFLDLGETEDRKKTCLGLLRERLKRDSDLKSRMDEEFLLRFLRFCKYDHVKAYTIVRKFYSIRHKRPDTCSLPSNMKPLIDSNFIRMLPYTDADGCVITVVSFGNWRLEKMSFLDLMSMSTALGDLVTMNPRVQVQGILTIYDARGVTLNHVAHVANLKTVQLLLDIFQTVYPWRIKKLFLANCSLLVHSLYKTVSLFLKKKIRDRIVLLGSDLSELHQHIKPEMLPKEFGGLLEDKECSLTELVMNNLDYLKYDREFGIARNHLH